MRGGKRWGIYSAGFAHRAERGSRHGEKVRAGKPCLRAALDDLGGGGGGSGEFDVASKPCVAFD